MISDYMKNIPRAFLTTSDNLLCYFFDKTPNNGPLFVNWDITHKCNSKCVFCNRWKVIEKDLTTEDKLEIIRQLGKSGVWLLSLCGGEPLLTEDLDLILREIKKQGMLINISTNGLLLKEKARLLVNSRTDFITISIQSHKLKTHDFLSGIDGSFKKINDGINSIKRIRKKNSPKIYGRLVFNELSLSNFTDFLNCWNKKVDEIMLQPICSSSKMLFRIPKEMKFSQKSRENFENFYGNLRTYKADNTFNRMVPRYVFQKAKLKNRIKCFSGYFFLTLDANGNLYSCSAHCKKIGNLKKEEFMSILNSKKMKDFKNIIRNKKNKCFCLHTGSMLNVYLSKFL